MTAAEAMAAIDALNALHEKSRARFNRQSPVIARLLTEHPNLPRMEKLIVSRADYDVLLDGETLKPGTSFYLMGVPLELAPSAPGRPARAAASAPSPTREPD